MDKLKGAIDSKVGGKSSQPGSGIERSADNAANAQADKLGASAGVPASQNDTIHKGLDSKINEKIPGGN
ncbi:uncharacterized protein PG998_012257 [Apiospora kogelbergensis]|uniref:MT0933-like antitoxin protein n=1 Tax=Apiospora kogelbergensis TaxID=1337665 RepID=A0AAW0QT05_9PEZI